MIDTGNCLKQNHTEHFKHSANTYFLGGYVKCVSDKFVYCLSTVHLIVCSNLWILIRLRGTKMRFVESVSVVVCVFKIGAFSDIDCVFITSWVIDRKLYVWKCDSFLNAIIPVINNMIFSLLTQKPSSNIHSYLWIFHRRRLTSEPLKKLPRCHTKTDLRLVTIFP
jgi:hypothetical protein